MSLDEKNLLISVNPCLYSFSFLAVGEVLYNLCLPQSHKKKCSYIIFYKVCVSPFLFRSEIQLELIRGCCVRQRSKLLSFQRDAQWTELLKRTTFSTLLQYQPVFL